MPVIKCEFCGKEYDEDPGKFCDQCGRALSRVGFEYEGETGGLVRCKNCGHRNAPDAEVCINCGERIFEKQML